MCVFCVYIDGYRHRVRLGYVPEQVVSVLVLFSGIVECNGGVAEEDEVEVILAQEPSADQEVPRDVILPEQSPGEFDFNEFFNLDKVPCLASVSVTTHLQTWMEGLEDDSVHKSLAVQVRRLNEM